MAIDKTEFRNGLGMFATGVTIITARTADGRDVGVTANSFNSVSLDPPLVLWSLNRNSGSLSAFTEGGHFAVHILGADQQFLSDRFAARGDEDRFAGLSFSRSESGIPLLDGCAARFECKLAYRYYGGDHEILVGEVVDFFHAETPPLIYFAGSYGKLQPSGIAGKDGPHPGEFTRLVSKVYHGLTNPVRRELGSHALSLEEYWVLRLLGYREPQMSQELAAKVSQGGTDLMLRDLEDMAAKLLISGDNSGWWLTESGRQAMVELAALQFSIEGDALSHFEASEIELLREMLERVAITSSHGLVAD